MHFSYGSIFSFFNTIAYFLSYIKKEVEFALYLNQELFKTTVTKDWEDLDRKIISQVLHNPAEYKKLIKDNFDLINIATKFPEFSEFLIQTVLQNQDEFERLINNNFELIITAKHWPKHASVIFDKVMQNQDIFERVVQCNSDLLDSVYYLPEFSEKLIQRVFQSSRDLKRLIQSEQELATIVQLWQSYREQPVTPKFLRIQLPFYRILLEESPTIEIKEQENRIQELDSAEKASESPKLIANKSFSAGP